MLLHKGRILCPAQARSQKFAKGAASRLGGGTPSALKFYIYFFLAKINKFRAYFDKLMLVKRGIEISSAKP